MSDQDDVNDAAGEDVFAAIPENLHILVEKVGFPTFEHMDEDDKSVFGWALKGRCMTCHGPLEDNCNFIVNRFGIVAAYCCGQCHSDMATIGWLQEQHEDLISAVKFRGGGADEAEEDDDSDA